MGFPDRPCSRCRADRSPAQSGDAWFCDHRLRTSSSRVTLGATGHRIEKGGKRGRLQIHGIRDSIIPTGPRTSRITAHDFEDPSGPVPVSAIWLVVSESLGYEVLSGALPIRRRGRMVSHVDRLQPQRSTVGAVRSLPRSVSSKSAHVTVPSTIVDGRPTKPLTNLPSGPYSHA